MSQDQYLSCTFRYPHFVEVFFFFWQLRILTPYILTEIYFHSLHFQKRFVTFVLLDLDLDRSWQYFQFMEKASLANIKVDSNINGQ